MHIPDGFLDAKTAASAAALSACGLGYALRRVKSEIEPRRIPALGLSAAFLFAAQMINFPVAGGTSGHLVGGALIAVLLGPSAAIIVVTTVLVVQCLLFADGGLLALGANIFNMAIVSSVVGYLVSRATEGILGGLRGKVAAMAFAGWCSAVAASLCCAAQLAWSRTVAWEVALPAMVGVHMLIGIGEGLISALVLLAVLRTRPEFAHAAQRPGVQRSLVLGLLCAFGIALFVTPLACTWPDGLESVAARLGFANRESAHLIASPAADYHLPGVHSPVLATSLAGAVGTATAFLLALALSRALVRNKPAPAEGAP